MEEYLRDLLNGPNGQFASLLLGIDAEKDAAPKLYKIVRETPAYSGLTGQPETWSDVLQVGTLEQCRVELERIVAYEGATMRSPDRATSTDGTGASWAISRA